VSDQITAGKGQLRARISELEAELAAMHKSPIKLEAERLSKEVELLRARVVQVEEHSARLVETALALAKLVNEPLGLP
jgi:hypothetical protein